MKHLSKSFLSFSWALCAFFALFTHTAAFSPKVNVIPQSEYVQDILYFDDSPNVIALREQSVGASYDDGVTWTDIDIMAKKDVRSVKFDPFIKERAFAFTSGGEHFVTNDKGKTWSKFSVKDSKGNALLGVSMVTVVPNAADPNALIFNFKVCEDWYDNPLSCINHHFYTVDGLKSGPKILSENVVSCTYVMATKEFTTSDKPSTVFCSRIKTNSFGHVLDSLLVKSSDYFATEQKVEHAILNSGKIIDLRVELSFLLAVVQSDRFNEKSQVSVLVSKDGVNFEYSDLEFEVSYGAILFLGSSPLSIFMSVGKGLRSGAITLATIYASDSTGLKYTKLIENVAIGSTSKVENVDGVWLTSVLLDHDKSDDDDMMDSFFGSRHYKRASKISVDDGRTWQDLAVLDDDSCKAADGCSLHVVDIRSFEKDGNYVSGPTPNILIASGTTGSHLGRFRKFRTYFSRDGGLTWRSVLNQGAVYSYGDQGNIIVALPFSGKKGTPSDKLFYSLNQGKSWSEYKLDTTVYPMQLITTLDGTGKKFVLSGSHPTKEYDYHSVLLTIDFSDAFDGVKCDPEKDFDKVFARVAEGDSGSLCIYGHTESFKRRKPDSKCFVSTLFEDMKVTEDPCDCSEKDFECSPYFKLSNKNECIPDPPKIAELCQREKKKSVNIPNKQLVAGNLCKSDKAPFITTEEFQCKDQGETPEKSVQIVAKLNELEGSLAQYTYVKTENELADNIIVQTEQGIAYASNNGGISFVRVPISEKIVGFMVGPVHGVVILFTSGEEFYISDDGGNTFTTRKAPGPPAAKVRPVSFDPEEPKNFLWFTGNCGEAGSSNCVSYQSDDFGETFKKLVDNAVACDFVSTVFGLVSQELIYCTVQDGNKRKLIYSTNLFLENQQNVLFDNIVSYAVRNNFVVVATIDEDRQELRAKVTVDGTSFAAADFPSDFKVKAQTSYAILDSDAHSIFMHVTTVSESGHERGAILKSNSNGTSYVLSLSDVNRDSTGYVDYDKMESIEGVLIANTVNNPDSTQPKLLKTQISFNDGSQWSFLPPPLVDVDGKKYPCAGQSLSKCSLNLHGFTERPDYRDTYSSSSAVGFLIGVGNVGETLDSYEKASTYLSIDGGLTWKEVAKGVYQWEYGDQGTILVLVDAINETDKIIYSTDEGKSWQEFKFSEKKVRVLDLATIPTDTARKFVIFARNGESKDGFSAISIDFTHFFKRQCQLDLDNPDKDDYEYWTPKHPESSEGCLFGHEAKYLRRALGHDDCFIGSAPLEQGYKEVRNCSCTRNDYECDYNFYRDTDGTCKLVKGLSPADHKASMCALPDTFQYFEPTGYRKLPLSTCVGGKEFDAFDPRPCPGHEKEFAKHYGRDMGAGKILVVILLPLFVFFAATWFVYDRGIRRNGGFSKLGQIRLDDDDDFNPIEENSVDVVVNRVVRGGIIIVAGTIALLKTIRKFDRALMERLTSSIFGRRPGRRNYVRVPDDEDELFGNFDHDYEEELEDGADVDFEVRDEPEEFTDFVDEPADADARLFDIDEHSDDGQSAYRDHETEEDTEGEPLQ